MQITYIKYFITFLFFCILILFTPTTLNASASITLENNISSYTDFKVDYLVEKSGKSLGINKISNIHFNKVISNAFSFGYKKNNFWFHLSVFNNTDETKNMVLEITEIIHKQLDLYEVSDTIIHKKNGLIVPIDEREIKESTPSFPLHFSPYENKELYIHLSSIYAVFGAIHIKTEEQYAYDTQVKKYLYLSFFSAMIMIVVYNLILFFYLRENIYLLYIGHVSIFIIWAANYKGLLLLHTTLKTYNLIQITIPIFFALLILFSQAILETKKYFSFFHKILTGYISLCVVTLVWMLIDMHYGFYFMNIIAAPILPFLFFIAFWALYNNHNIAKLYLIALTTYLVGMGLLSFLALGILPYSIMLSNSAMIGAFFEVLFFSLLLAYRINIVRQESLKSQKELIVQQKTESSRLFHTVAQKTMALNNAKEQLEKELAQKASLEKHLKYLASTDPMTELLNRRAFFDISDKEMLTANSRNQELSCLIVDIDHFKVINDTYGHDIGDRVISTIAKLMIENTRTVDYIGRIGGEEFAILMPNTDMESAYQISDRLRENISKHKMILDNKAIQITISIGLSYLTDKDKNIHTLLKRADTALYEAKENGRNQVCCI